jgi:hypothetical protein
MAAWLRGEAPPLWWPPKYPSEVRAQPFDLSGVLPSATGIVSLTAAIAPSGAGELTPTALSLLGSVLTLTVSGGQARRGQHYTILFTTTLADGEAVQFEIKQRVIRYLPSDTAQAITASGFGTPITWTAAPLGLNSGFLTVVTNFGLPTGSAGLWPGACWDNGGFLAVIPGVTPEPSAPPLYAGSVTASQLLWYGAGYLPITQPAAGSGQLWNNGGFVCAA